MMPGVFAGRTACCEALLRYPIAGGNIITLIVQKGRHISQRFGIYIVGVGEIPQAVAVPI
jgi:hypothetical protein